MYVCILDQKGKTQVHKNIKTNPGLFFELIFEYLDDVAASSSSNPIYRYLDI